MMTEIKILTKDLYKLSARHFIPQKPVGKQVIIINSATGVKQHFYGHFAAFLSSRGFHVYTYDYRGIGASRYGCVKDIHTSILQWGEDDFTAVIKYIHQRHPFYKVSVIGHSLGGQIIGMSPLAHTIDNFVMVASQTPFWRHYRGAMLAKVWLLWHVLIPVLTRTFGYFPARTLGLFEDLPGQVALQWARWGKHGGYFTDELPHKLDTFSSLSQRTLVYSFEDDPLAPRDAVGDLLSYYPNLKVDHRHVSPKSVNRKSIGHFNFFRKSSEDIFWDKVSEWLLEEVPDLKFKVPSL